MSYYDFDYPVVRQTLAEAALREAYPTLLLNARGDIRGVNPLALWLWGALRPGEPIHSEQLIGVNSFTLLARHVDRLPTEQNQQMYTLLSAIVKRSLERRYTSARAIYRDFITTMLADARRAQLYESALLYPEKEWEYPLKITHPQDAGILLAYTVSTFHLQGNAGFLVVYYPDTTTLAVIEEINSLLIENYGEGAVSISQNSDTPAAQASQSHIIHPVVHYRPYYPALVQDPLWYLCGENEAHRLLMGTSVLGLHFLELFLSPPVRSLLGPIQDSTGPRALKYFDLFTEPYRQEGHFLHEKYNQLIKRLKKLDGFPELLEIARRLPIHTNSAAQLNLATVLETPFYTCRVLIPWPYDHNIRLQFKSMVNFVFTDELIARPDLRNFQDTLVPENDETDVALMLLPHLAVQPPAWRDKSLVQQFFWFLALVKIVEEGREIGEHDITWNPQDAYEHVIQTLTLRYAAVTADNLKTIQTEIQATIEVLDRHRKIDKGRLLTLLHTYTVTQLSLQALSTFLKEEIKVERQKKY